MRAALAEIAEVAEQSTPLSSNDVVLDIGCNDGTLLRSYRRNDLKRIGFEPAANLVEDARVGTTAVVNDFFSSAAYEAHFGKAKARIITSIAMFYDLENPNQFVEDVARCLEKDGLWIIQMSYLPSMLEQNAFDNICHEHLEYYSLTSLRALVSRHGLRICDVHLNDVNGGSFRVFLRHDSSSLRGLPGDAERLKNLESHEDNLGLRRNLVYEKFARRVEDVKANVCRFIRGEVARGKTVYAYGASTKGNTLLQYFGLDSKLIGAAIEKNKDKWGKQTVGTGIPIISEEEGRAANPDYMLILPWHFLNEFRDREKQFLEGGGKFIVPLPRFRVLSG